MCNVKREKTRENSDYTHICGVNENGKYIVTKKRWVSFSRCLRCIVMLRGGDEGKEVCRFVQYPPSVGSKETTIDCCKKCAYISDPDSQLRLISKVNAERVPYF